MKKKKEPSPDFDRKEFLSRARSAAEDSQKNGTYTWAEACNAPIGTHPEIDAMFEQMAEAERTSRAIRELPARVERNGVAAVLRHLKNAEADPVVAQSTEGAKLVKFLVSYLGSSPLLSTLDDLARPLIDIVETQGLSRRASEAAKSKNAEPKKWVISEWKSRSDRGQGKASFGRQYSSLVKRKFDLKVLPETIARDWLPRGRD